VASTGNATVIQLIQVIFSNIAGADLTKEDKQKEIKVGCYLLSSLSAHLGNENDWPIAKSPASVCLSLDLIFQIFSIGKEKIS
jgi:hypothetical protein